MSVCESPRNHEASAARSWCQCTMTSMDDDSAFQLPHSLAHQSRLIYTNTKTNPTDPNHNLTGRVYTNGPTFPFFGLKRLYLSIVCVRCFQEEDKWLRCLYPKLCRKRLQPQGVAKEKEFVTEDFCLMKYAIFCFLFISYITCTQILK